MKKLIIVNLIFVSQFFLGCGLSEVKRDAVVDFALPENQNIQLDDYIEIIKPVTTTASYQKNILVMLYLPFFYYVSPGEYIAGEYQLPGNENKLTSYLTSYRSSMNQSGGTNYFRKDYIRYLEEKIAMTKAIAEVKGADILLNPWYSLDTCKSNKIRYAFPLIYTITKECNITVHALAARFKMPR